MLYGVSTPLAALAWPRRRLATAAWLLQAVAVYPLLWGAPGGVAVVVAMVSLLVMLRALDARASFGGDRVRYALYCHWLEPHPTEAERRSGPIGVRLVRAVACAAATAGLLAVAVRTEVWRSAPYLDDLLGATGTGLAFVAIVDGVTVGSAVAGRPFFLVDGVAPGFAASRSLATFWSRDWNRPTAGVLNRGVFGPLSGRRQRARGVLAVFLACGVMHALPLVLGGRDRALWAWIAAGSLLFFVAHAVGVLVSGAVPALRRGAGGRLWLLAVFAATAPLYPSALLIALGLGTRPPASYTPLVVLRALAPDLLPSAP